MSDVSFANPHCSFLAIQVKIVQLNDVTQSKMKSLNNHLKQSIIDELFSIRYRKQLEFLKCQKPQQFHPY